MVRCEPKPGTAPRRGHQSHPPSRRPLHGERVSPAAKRPLPELSVYSCLNTVIHQKKKTFLAKTQAPRGPASSFGRHADPIAGGHAHVRVPPDPINCDSAPSLINWGISQL